MIFTAINEWFPRNNQLEIPVSLVNHLITPGFN